MSKPENPSAFPSGDFERCEPGYGMTLRDWFAGQAVTGVILATSSGEHVPSLITEWKREIGPKPTIEQAMAADAYRVADAMLAERTRTTGDAA